MTRQRTESDDNIANVTLLIVGVCVWLIWGACSEDSEPHTKPRIGITIKAWASP